MLRFLFVCFFVGLISTFGACGKAAEGAFCDNNDNCEEGLTCLRNRCVKRRTYTPDEPGPEPVVEPAAEPVVEPQSEPTPDATEVEPPAPDKAAEPPAPDKATPPEPRPEPRPEPPQDVVTDGSLSIYEAVDPNSPKAPADNTAIKIKEAVITTPSVRLSGTLNTFFVQALAPRQGTFKYGGLMIVYERASYPNLSFAIGTIVSLEGSFVRYKSSGATVGMPQINLTAMPQSQGNTPPPAPEVVTPKDVRAGANAEAYLSVLVVVKNVVVTDKNPDAPRDYSEFAIADANDRSNDLRVDDLINTILYTGSKFCNGCSQKPKNPDDSYCLAGESCQCDNNTGRCYTGAARADMRNDGDTFQEIAGVLRYANGNFKLQPRIPTDMK